MQDQAKHKTYSAVENIISTFQLLLWPKKERALIWESLFWCLYWLTNELSHPLWPSEACHLKELLNIDPKAALCLFSALCCFWDVTWSLLASYVFPSPLRSSWPCLPHSGKWKHQRNVWAVPGSKAEPHFQLCRCLLSQSELQQLFSSLLLLCTTYSSNCLPGMQQLMRLEDRLGWRS